MIIIAKLVKQTLLANARYYCIPICFSIVTMQANLALELTVLPLPYIYIRAFHKNVNKIKGLTLRVGV